MTVTITVSILMASLAGSVTDTLPAGFTYVHDWSVNAGTQDGQKVEFLPVNTGGAPVTDMLSYCVRAPSTEVPMPGLRRHPGIS